MPENIADKANNDTRIVKQFTNPVKEPIDSDINLFDLLDERAERDPDGAMIEYKTEDGTWQPYSALVFRDMVIDLAKGLIGLGVNKGESVAIVSRTRWEWTALDMAIMSIGALTVPVYETNSASQVSWIFNDSKVTLAIAEDDGQRDKIESVRSEVPTLRNVFVIEAGGLNAIKTYGESVTDAEFWEYKNASHGDDRATIVYTSGSTGTPKGVELTHRNFAFLVRSALQYMPLSHFPFFPASVFLCFFIIPAGLHFKSTYFYVYRFSRNLSDEHPKAPDSKLYDLIFRRSFFMLASPISFQDFRMTCEICR